MMGRLATINLSQTQTKSMSTKHEIKKSAFHEVTEGLLLTRMLKLAEYRFTTQDEINEEAHNITRILENVVFEKNNK